MGVLVPILVIAGIGGLLYFREKKAAAPAPVAKAPSAVTPPPVVITAPPTPVDTTTAVGSTVSTISSSIPVVGPVVSAVENVVLGAHVARLKGAIAENQTIPTAVQAFDEDLAEIVDAYNNGEATAAQCITALKTMDTQMEAWMYSNTGAAGTSWTAPRTAQIGQGNTPSYSATCNKSCTASCCVYLNDLRPAIYGRGGLGGAYAPYQTNGVIVGAIQILQQGSGVLKVIAVAPPDDPSYGNFSRAAYNVTFTKPVTAGKGTAVMTVPKTIAHLA